MSGQARARVALLGNPSDGFGGRTLGLAIAGMTATVTLGSQEDGRANRLIEATIARYNRSRGTSVPARASLRTTIPREVGLAGSSAIVIATLRALCADRGVRLEPDELAAMALAVEAEDLGIAAGPQDRFVQAHEGLLYMDFAGAQTRCEHLDPELLPPLFSPTARTPRPPRATCTETCAGASRLTRPAFARSWARSPSSQCLAAGLCSRAGRLSWESS